MELIIKPTGRCNFNCTFCSANLLNIKHSDSVPSQIKELIKLLKPHGLIITGGDPLMMKREYYEELLSMGDYNISFTTNLKGFYLNPDYWTPLLKNERIGICTSFQYGSGRMFNKDTVYDETLFKTVMRMFEERVGYMPSFISIISEDNEDKVLDHIYLAKELRTKCKLNPLLAIGKSKTFYPKYKIVDIWLKIKELGLEDYLDTSAQFYEGGCAFNTSLMCETTIRAAYVDNNDKLHYSSCEDCLSAGIEIGVDKVRPIEQPTDIPLKDYINNNCLYCELSRFCNGCKSARNTAKITPNYCEEMLKRKQKILESGWKL